MTQMSPLAAMLLRIMRVACLVSAVFLALIAGIEGVKQWQAGGVSAMSRADAGFLAILLVMLVGFLWLARSIRRELAKSGP